MKSHFSKLAVSLAITCFLIQSASSHITTIAITGADAPGVPSATWSDLGRVTLNNVGELAFSARLEHSADINANNDLGIWHFDLDGQLIAQTGVGNVPGVASADFAEIETPLLSDNGTILVYGSLVTGDGGIDASNNRGVWAYDGAAGTLKARTGSGNVPDMPGANFSSILSSPGVLSRNGDFGFLALMQTGVGGVLNTDDRGIWRYKPSGATLVAREGLGGVPDIQGARFDNFAPPAINASDQLALFGTLKEGIGVNRSNSAGIWRYNDNNGDLLARTGSGNVPEMAASLNFSSFTFPLINNSGHVAFSAELSDESKGVWLYGEAGGTSIVSPSKPLPDLAAVGITEISLSGFNDAGQLLASVVLEEGVAGVTTENNLGIWLLNGDDQLIARSGSGGVPGIADAHFADFTAAAINEPGQIAIQATMQSGFGGVDASNDSGLWLIDPAGASWLVAREGDQLDGRTIDGIDLVTNVSGEPSGFNDRSELAFQATFTSGDSGVFLFRPYAADFDRDGGVNSADLAFWQTAYSNTSLADADLDNDSDGADYLVWQQQSGSGTASQPILSKVPEPTSCAQLVLAVLFRQTVRRRSRRIRQG